MKQKLLIINKTQFGYHTDYYKYCEYLKNDYNITFLCFDSGREKLNMKGVFVKYVSSRGNFIYRGLSFFVIIFLELQKPYSIIFIKYFPYCKWLKKVFPNKKMILDIRSLSVTRNKKKRIIYDRKLRKACNYFDFVTIISEGLREKLLLSKNKSSVLPLGADIISNDDKDFSSLKLLYVGTFNNRNIEITIEGLALFLENYPNFNITYDIVGFGNKEEEKLIKETIRKFKLDKVVFFHGRIPHFKLYPFFKNCNIGVSYVPIKDYYNFQPVTKTFEYILSGMACIGTNTYENRKIITAQNGEICDDTAEGFKQALEAIMLRRHIFNSKKIQDTLSNYLWENIVTNELLPVLKDNC